MPDSDVMNRLLARRAELKEGGRSIVEPAAAEKRKLSEGEQGRVLAILTEIRQIDERVGQLNEQEDQARKIEDGFANLAKRRPVGRVAHRNPLAYTHEALSALQASIDTRSAGRFLASDTEVRAALATTTYGAPRAWGANVLGGPRLLHVAAVVPQQAVDATYAQYPVLTLPTASASVGENVTLAEYASSTAGSVTLARFGRWTDISREGLIGADAGAMVAMHQVAIARDLDAALIDLVETAAGSAVAFTADVPAAIRGAMAEVTDNTAADEAGALVVLVNPDNAALLQDIAPISGGTIAEGFQRFSGALVYPSAAVATGTAVVGTCELAPGSSRLAGWPPRRIWRRTPTR